MRNYAPAFSAGAPRWGVIPKNILSIVVNVPQINHLIVNLLISKLGMSKLAIMIILLMI